ncbi:MAG TPA: DUF2891 family protein, partial [Candidatus Deferrimicrobium sp.]|nr:DUF2891 family protein [Candidatus Deferrimicrobium sp.]
MSIRMIAVFIVLFIFPCVQLSVFPAEEKKDITINPEMASQFAAMAMRCVEKEFPNKLDHVMNDEKEVLSPRTLHPAFYGCFDWHSSVHGH